MKKSSKVSTKRNSELEPDGYISSHLRSPRYVCRSFNRTVDVGFNSAEKQKGLQAGFATEQAAYQAVKPQQFQMDLDLIKLCQKPLEELKRYNQQQSTLKKLSTHKKPKTEDTELLGTLSKDTR